LTGTAAAAGLAANSVGSKQLKKNAVKTAKIKNNAVTAAKIKDGSVGLADLAPGVLSSEPTVFEHVVAPGAPMSAVTVAGIRFTPSCTGTSTTATAQVAVGSDNNLPEMTYNASLITQVGADTDAVPVVGRGVGSVSITAPAAAGANAFTMLSGDVKSAAGPWVRITLGMRATLGASKECQLRLVAAVLD
ncbi:hypothetical protein, partial [Nocardioides dilutus]